MLVALLVILLCTPFMHLSYQDNKKIAHIAVWTKKIFNKIT